MQAAPVQRMPHHIVPWTSRALAACSSLQVPSWLPWGIVHAAQACLTGAFAGQLQMNMATVVLLLEDAAIGLRAGSYVDTQGMKQVRFAFSFFLIEAACWQISIGSLSVSLKRSLRNSGAFSTARGVPWREHDERTAPGTAKWSKRSSSA
jgi:hypothetical protein